MKGLILPLVLLLVIVSGLLLYSTFFQNVELSLEGIHVMGDGTVMNGNGDIVEGAFVAPNGDITLSSGKVVGTTKLGTPFSTDIENLPYAKSEPEMVYLRNGDVYELTAGYVKKEVGNTALRMLAYNGSVPGPIIKAEQGTEVTINFNNATDIEQTVHSHGIRIDNAFDGVPYGTQNPVLPGDTFSYKVRFDDAGVFWYHPHTREDYAQELGLYGNYLIEPSEENYWNTVNREIPLVLDDILIQNDKIAPFYEELTNFALLGRFGNEHLVNGESGYTLSVKKGEVVRFFVTNVANARTYNLSVPGAKIKLVGADLGRYEREEFVDSVLLSPAERAVVEVWFEKEGTYELFHTDPNGATKLSTFTVVGAVGQDFSLTFKKTRENTSVIAEFAPLQKYLYAEPQKELLLTVLLTGAKIDHSKHMHMTSYATATEENMPNIQWDDIGQSDQMNTTGKTQWQLLDLDTRKKNMEIDDWHFKKGDLVKIAITNDQNADHVMQHPVHFHGQRFVVLERNGVPTENKVWKDTTLVLPGETISILVEMSNPGEWMAHCHIAEHLHAGMILNFTVANEEGIVPGEDYRKTVPSHMTH